MAAAAQQALQQAQQRMDLAKLPILTGNSNKDSFSVEEWAERVTRATAVAGWDDQTTMVSVYNALREDALHFYTTLRRRDSAAIQTWVAFKALLLEYFSKNRNGRITTKGLTQLTQKPAETVLQFYNRVDAAVADLQAISVALARPAEGLGVDIIAACAGAAINEVAQNAVVDRLQTNGVNHAWEQVAAQMFIAGLKESIHKSLSTNQPPAGYATLWQAFQQAKLVETSQMEPTQAQRVATIEAEVIPAAAEDQPEDLEAQIAALQRRLGKAKPKFAGNCFHCNKPGHRKSDCWTLRNQNGQASRGQPARGRGWTRGRGRGSFRAGEHVADEYNPFSHMEGDIGDDSVVGILSAHLN